MPRSPALTVFHPTVQEWFTRRYGEPTEIQIQAWPTIAAGQHLLATAPTGSGKTLAAFLWSLNQLLTGKWESGQVRVLYVSPLKALNNDIQRNLLEPLSGLEAALVGDGIEPQSVRVATRSGDTQPSERRRMLRHPPEILITTPESLNILLTSQGGRQLLTGIETVILDEIHSVAAGKRGTHLITAIDRLILLSGEFQRVALSATVRPLETIARFVGGWQLHRRGDLVSYEERPVTVLRGTASKRYQVRVDFPANLGSRPTGGVERATLPLPGTPRSSAPSPAETEIDPDLLWARLAVDLKATVKTNRSTLIFANSRRMAERITLLINENEVSDLVYSHHGSLAREIRTAVEDQFKQGKLEGIVATNSLELGIDIGDLDEVLLLQTPPSINSAVQRIGRAGHAVGATSRGTFYPLFGKDLITATVVAEAVEQQDIEPIRPIEGALDVLAQVLLSMTSSEEWEVESLFDQIRTSAPYHNLSRTHFDLVLEMLAGRYAQTRQRELTPRIHWNRIDNTLTARRSAARLIYTSGGTIPDRGYYQLRVQGSMSKIGELDEEFVWERKINDRFTLGTQSWRIVQITHNDVIVAPAHGGAALAPFWRGEAVARGAHLSNKIAQFLEWAEGRLSLRGRQAGVLVNALTDRFPITESAAEALVQLLESQRAATGTALPHKRHLVVERVRDPQKPTSNDTIIVHTLWGREVLRPLAMALSAAWEEKLGTLVDITHDDDGLMIHAPHPIDTEELLALVDPDRIEELLRGRLEISGYFGARFRENSGRALLLPRAGFDRRVPLWLTRQRSKKLLASTSEFENFPMVLETWRTCLHDEFDLEALRSHLDDLSAGSLQISECVTSTPSPFAAGLSWNLTNRLMYEDDAAEAGTGSSLSTSLLQDLVKSGELRPRISRMMADRLQEKLHRTFSGYSPLPGTELVEWVKERLAVPPHEWQQLLQAVANDHSLTNPVETLDEPSRQRLVMVGDANSQPLFVTALETLPHLLGTLGFPGLTQDRDGPSAPQWQYFDVFDTELIRTAEVLTLLSTVVPSETPHAGDPGELLAQWLRYYGPIPITAVAQTWGFDEPDLLRILEGLGRDDQVVLDLLLEGSTSLEICDSQNLERLFRLRRQERRPQIQARPLEELPLFLAVHQGIAPRTEGIEGVQQALDHLFGFSAPAGLWETEFFPSRLDPYQSSWLDSLMQEGDLMWRGTGPQRLTFVFSSDLDLLPSSPNETSTETSSETQVDPDTGPKRNPLAGDSGTKLLETLDPGRYLSLVELSRRTALPTGTITDRLWDLSWTGRVTNDTYLVVRRGLGSGFKSSSPQPNDTLRATLSRTRRARPSRRSRLSKWSSSRTFAGHWTRIEDRSTSTDTLEREALKRERARLVLERYGVVFRELLLKELPGLRWADLFRSLRLMELAGEIVSGHFFTGIPGIQFASPTAVRRLRLGVPEDLVYWINACDPASPSGLGLEFQYPTPRRLPGNHLVFHGSRLVLISERQGRRLSFLVPPDSPDLDSYLDILRAKLGRGVAPVQSVEIETINDIPARKSEYRESLSREFQVSSAGHSIRLWRRYEG